MTQNPLGAIVSVPVVNHFDFGALNGKAYILNVTPVVPVAVGDRRLINRFILTVAFIKGPLGDSQGIPNPPATGFDRT